MKPDAPHEWIVDLADDIDVAAHPNLQGHVYRISLRIGHVQLDLPRDLAATLRYRLSHVLDAALRDDVTSVSIDEARGGHVRDVEPRGRIGGAL